jgi:acyl-coenzyme A synthetase/AMP-(fatty) acid ligase
MLYRLLSDAARKQGRRREGVRHVIVTGDSIAPTALGALAGLFPDARLHNVYGCTETNDSFTAEIDVRVAARRGEVTIGMPLPGVSALVVAASGDVIDGPGEGELWVCTPFQTDGYLDASLNSGKFEPHPQGLDGRTYFRTGDIVRRHEDGSIALCGRNDSLVKVRGVRVSTQAVEQALLEHESVVEVAVVAVADAVTGSRLRAVVRRADSSRLDSLILRRHCAGRLEPAAIPSRIDIVTYPLPKTTTGKVDRRRSVPNEPRRSVA